MLTLAPQYNTRSFLPRGNQKTWSSNAHIAIQFHKPTTFFSKIFSLMGKKGDFETLKQMYRMDGSLSSEWCFTFFPREKHEKVITPVETCATAGT
jgi:hypothetical protein